LAWFASHDTSGSCNPVQYLGLTTPNKLALALSIYWLLKNPSKSAALQYYTQEQTTIF